MQDGGNRDVAELLVRARRGEQAAWDALVQRFTGLLWSIARSFRLDDATAGDVVQTTWLRLLEHLDDVLDPGQVGAWLSTTARRECLRLRNSARREVLSPYEALERVDDDRPPVDASLLQRERDAELWAAVGRLSRQCRELLRVLMASPPPSYQEVGRALDMPTGSIGPTRARCLGHLRRELAEPVSSAVPQHSAE